MVRAAKVVFVSTALVGSLLAMPMAASGQTPECTISGTEGDDVLVGTSGNDVICGLGGNDTISGGSGHDIIFGGSGDDVITGGSGNDIVYGEEGADEIDGGSGNDVVEGGPGDDMITGGSGNDELRGGPGTDSASGSSGTDVCASETVSSCEEELPDETGSGPETVMFSSLVDGDVVFGVEQVPVSVTPETAEGTVDLVVDGNLVGTSEILDGSATFAWDTATLADGEHTVEVDARDGTGAVTAQDSVVVVAANALPGPSRIQLDGETGQITLDEYVEYGIWSITNPSLLPERYQVEESGLAETTGLGMWFLASWEGLTADTQQRIADYLTLTEYEIPLEEAAAPSGLLVSASFGLPILAQVSSGFPECEGLFEVQPVYVVYSKMFRCQHEVVVDGDVRFSIYYTVEGLDDPDLLQRARVNINPLLSWAETVSDENVSGDPNVPDRIEDIAASLVESWDTYADLGFTEPDVPADVVVHGTAGAVLPPVPGGSTLVQVSNSGSFHYLPRHELFHLFQYEYVDLLDFGVNRQLSVCLFETGAISAILDLLPLDLGCDSVAEAVAELNWFQELTAEWAAHQVQEGIEQSGGTVDEPTNYALNLPAFLGVPQQPLDAWNGFGGSIQYGAFILAEYLEERFPINGQPDPSVIESIWGRIDDLGGKPIEALGVELGSRGTFMDEFLTGFASTNYVLAPVPPNGQTLGAYDDSDAALVWRPRLGDIAATQGETDALALQYGLDHARPARDQHLFVVGQDTTGSTVVSPGGTAYIDLLPELPDTDGVVTVDVTTDQDLATVQVLAFDTYPELCQEPEFVPLADGTGSLGVAVGNGCRFATLAITNPDPEGSSITVDWEATLVADGANLLFNGSFETGDLAGWSVFETLEPPPAGEFPTTWTVTDSAQVHDGLYSVLASAEGFGPDGLAQTVDLPSAGWYRASAWLFDVNGTREFELEVYDADGDLIASQPAIWPMSGEWQELAVEFYSDSPSVTLRLTYLAWFSESATWILDDAQLIASAAGPATNLDFETGDLTGWTIVESGDPGTQYETVSPGLDGTNHAFHLTSTGQPIDGIQQTIQWQYANCSVELLATGAAGNTVQLSVLDASDGSTWGSDSYTFTGEETAPVQLFVDGPTFYLPTVYTIQLLYVASSTAVDLVIDEVKIGECT
jgi:hypothetical protein